MYQAIVPYFLLGLSIWVMLATRPTESQSSEGLPCDTYNVTLDQIGFLKGQDYTLNCSMMSSRSGRPVIILFQVKNSSSDPWKDVYTAIVVDPKSSFFARAFESSNFVNAGLIGNRSAFITLNATTLPTGTNLLWQCNMQTAVCIYGIEAEKELILIGKPSNLRVWSDGLHLWLLCCYI